jgi:hypothetical protein
MPWEGEIFGLGMFEAIAEIQPEHADTEAVSKKLNDLGGTPETREVAKLPAEVG